MFTDYVLPALIFVLFIGFIWHQTAKRKDGKSIGQRIGGLLGRNKPSKLP